MRDDLSRYEPLSKIDKEVISRLERPFDLIAEVGRYVPIHALLEIDSNAILLPYPNRSKATGEIMSVTFDWGSYHSACGLFTLPIDLYNRLREHTLALTVPFLCGEIDNFTLFHTLDHKSITFADYLAALQAAMESLRED